MNLESLVLTTEPGLGEQVSAAIREAIVDATGILSELIVALLILLVGYWLAGKARSVTVRLALRADLDPKVARTPLGPLFGEGDGAAAGAFGTIVRYYIILVAAFTAFDHIGFSVVTQWLEGAVTYVPLFLGGLLVLIVGFYITDFAVDAVRRSRVAQSSGVPGIVAEVTKAVLYFLVLAIGLDTLGVNVGILYAFGETILLVIGLAAALAIGIAFGWGGKDYVAENIENWHDETGDGE